MRRIVPPLLALVAAIALFLVALGYSGSPNPPRSQLDGPLIPTGMAAPNFTLRDQNGPAAIQYHGLVDRRGVRVGYQADELVAVDLVLDTRVLLTGPDARSIAPAKLPRRRIHAASDLPRGDVSRAAARAAAANIPYGGGPVLHRNRTHLIFWQPTGSGLSFDPEYQSLIETFLARVAANSHLPSSVYGLTGQYRDSEGPAAYDSTYAGATLARDGLPPNECREPPPPPGGDGPGWSVCLTDQQLQLEVMRVVARYHLPKGPNDIYFLVTPSGLGSCSGAGPENCALGGQSGGYCGYHSATDDGILYAVIPYNAVPGHCQSEEPRPNSSTADPAINTLSEEQTETVTDPFGNGWVDAAGAELGDVCSTTYGPNLGDSSGATAYDQVIDGGHYMLHEFWSNEDGGCRAADEPDPITPAVPARVPGDRWVRLRAWASDPDGRIIGYRWLFDGRQVRGWRVAYAFDRAGTFTVAVTSVDSAGNYASSSQPVAVVRPPAPVVRVLAVRRPPGGIARVRASFTSTAAIASYQCRVDNGRWRRCRSPYLTSALAAGTHALWIRARDTFGQLSSSPARELFSLS